MHKPAGFPRQDRLLCRRDFDPVFKHPGRSSDPFFTILFKHSKLDHARLGLAIAKKVARRAVDRNRIKRLLRESFRTRHTFPAVDLVVMIKPGAVSASNTQLYDALEQHWQRITRKTKHHV